jgi:large subunit ribosomal protein L20
MPRAKKGFARRKPKKRILKAIRGRRGSSKLYRLAKEARVRSLVFARTGRKLRKRSFRALWITRLTAACRNRGLRYSQLINGCKKAKINLNRKMLSEIAIADPAAFDLIASTAKAAIA